MSATTARTPNGALPPPGAQIANAVARLAATAHGREVADFMRSSAVQVQVVPDARFRAQHSGSGGVYDARTRVVSIPEGALYSRHLVTTLAHEGTHAQDFSTRPRWMLQSLAIIAGTSGDAARAALTLRNPVTAWLDSLTSRQNEDEVHAYHVQAQVAQEIGLNESGWAHGQAADGSARPLDEVRADIAADDLYRMEPSRRLVFGAGLGVGFASTAALAGQGIAKRLRPDSFLAAHGWPMFAAGGMLAGVWVLGDQLRSRRLDGAARGATTPVI